MARTARAAGLIKAHTPQMAGDCPIFTNKRPHSTLDGSLVRKVVVHGGLAATLHSSHPASSCFSASTASVFSGVGEERLLLGVPWRLACQCARSKAMRQHVPNWPQQKAKMPGPGKGTGETEKPTVMQVVGTERPSSTMGHGPGHVGRTKPLQTW